MAAKLKTFVTSDGLMEYVVATTSRAKALAAWGVRQDLFKEGRARETDDAALIKAAVARPGEVFTRASGGKALKLPKAEKAPAKPKGPTAVQRRKVANLERGLEALEAHLAETLDALSLERSALDAREVRERTRYDKDRAALEARLKAARAAGSG